MTHAKLRALWIVVAPAFFVVSSAAAQTAMPSGGYLDVNLAGYYAAQHHFSNHGATSLYGEPASWTFAYEVPDPNGLDVEGGLFFTPHLGVGLVFAHATSDGRPTITATMPMAQHPNAAVTDTYPGTVRLWRRETAWHLQLVYKIHLSPRLQARLSFGPSRFSARQEFITDFDYAQAWLGNGQRLTISGYDSTEQSGTAWGVHAGVDVGFFFTRNVGVGMLLRVARASVTFPDSAATLAGGTGEQSLKVGGTSIGLGGRLRF